MKRLLAIILVAAMAACACVVASADTITNFNTNNTASAEVSVAFVNAKTEETIETAETVYSVEIGISDMSFNWKVNNTTETVNKIVWDPATHTYKVGSTEGETVTLTAPEAQTITVTNHSNAAVRSAAAVKGEEVNGVTASVAANGDQVLENAADVAYNDVLKAAKETYTVSVSGTPINLAKGFSLDTVTVTISAAQ